MSAAAKSNIPERAVKVASHFPSENPCPQIKREISGIIEYSNAERQEMDKLNSKMSAYVGQVVKLEQENKELIDQIHDMRTNWGFETNGVRIRCIFIDNYLLGWCLTKARNLRRICL